MVELEGSDPGVQGLKIQSPEALERERTKAVNEAIGTALIQLLSALYVIKQAPLTIVETGTVRDGRLEGHEDGLSTLFIARWVKQSGVAHRFYSFDIEAGHIISSREFLADQELDGFVTYGLGDAEKLLEHFCLPIDFAYLDAGADPVQNLLQFRRVQKWMREPGLVVIDDVYDVRNANKGLVTVPFARLEGLKDWKLLDRMAVIAFGEQANFALK
jgi:predicted O-methyltransferase YrrM